jgi:hypothetical protein
MTHPRPVSPLLDDDIYAEQSRTRLLKLMKKREWMMVKEKGSMEKGESEELITLKK